MASSPSANFSPLVSREQGRNAVGDALRLFVGRGRRWSVKQLSNATGIPDWQINAAMIDGGSVDNRPLPPEALLSVAKFIGPAFTNEWLRLANQLAVVAPEELDFDDLCDLARDFVDAKVAAHRADSPMGPAIAPCEQTELHGKALRLVGGRDAA